MSSSDEFNDPFSEDTGGGLLETEGGMNIQAAKVAKERGEEELEIKAYSSLQKGVAAKKWRLFPTAMPNTFKNKGHVD